MSLPAPNINRFWADLIVDELVRCGVHRFFLAPGSRSSPIVTALAQHAEAHSTIHFDERGAAFAALGYGRATRRPAAWITTSGTAAANGLPAIVEASQSHVPLIAITADRPPELRDAGANQAIDQIRLFGHYPRWFFDLPCPSPDIDPSFVLTTIDQAIQRATASPAGPVHLNCPYREPLAPSPDGSVLPELPNRWLNARRPFTVYHEGTPTPDSQTTAEMREDVENAARGLLVVGELATIAEAEAVDALAASLGWPVIADLTSQMRLGEGSDMIVGCPHFTCAALADRLEPQLIVRIGGPISSKDVQQYLDRSGARIVAVQEHGERKDAGHVVSTVLRASVGSFCAILGGLEANVDPDWVKTWLDAGRRISTSLEQNITALDDLSEPGAASIVTRNLPHDHALFVASSMPIRDVDMFGSARGRLRRVAANRGASGIDGTVASAFGYHLGMGNPATLFIGDLALLHDLNSLALVRSHPITIVVVNNRGGGIFNFLPIADHADVFEPWFTAPHSWSFEHAARMFGLEYAHPARSADLKEAYVAAVNSGEATLIEIDTDRVANRALHAQLRALAIKAGQEA